MKSSKVNPNKKRLPSFHVSAKQTDLIGKLQQLKPISGYCIIIDIVDSTKLKDKTVEKWIIAIYNTFINIKSEFFFKFRPLKSMGDALMFFIWSEELQGETPLTLFGACRNLVTNDDSAIRDVKVAINYCENVFAITFLKSYPDVYGKEIDLTARLLSVARPNEVIIGSSLYEKIQAEYQASGNKQQWSDVTKIYGPWPTEFKGFSEQVTIYKFRRMI